ncbi:hypothetical protein EV421DRAFT_1743702 [Armillaria borealis]|uniref:Uncharacterized protein n=1 Tax=Armillaria borealis TaxID=47425 RepID=A0AA39IVU7_9AGAR|nr:hypothetical protein EV421DRAFT_1743702 [Armillaria borealis]
MPSTPLQAAPAPFTVTPPPAPLSKRPTMMPAELYSVGNPWDEVEALLSPKQSPTYAETAAPAAAMSPVTPDTVIPTMPKRTKAILVVCTSTPPPSSHSPYRLIFSWMTPPPVDIRLPAHTIAETIATVICNQSPLSWPDRRPIVPPGIKGVHWTKGGSLVVHTQAPYPAERLLREHVQVINQYMLIDKACQEHGLPTAYLDLPWKSVVVHGVPVLKMQDDMAKGSLGKDFDHALLEEEGIYWDMVQDVQLLCRSLEGREMVSLQLSFEDHDIADGLLRHRFLSIDQEDATRVVILIPTILTTTHPPPTHEDYTLSSSAQLLLTTTYWISPFRICSISTGRLFNSSLILPGAFGYLMALQLCTEIPSFLAIDR